MILKTLSVLSVFLLLSGCGEGSEDDAKEENNNSIVEMVNTVEEVDSKYNLKYKSLVFYNKDMDQNIYTLEQLKDENFNELNKTLKLQIADKLLGSLFFGYQKQDLQQKIDSGIFLETIYKQLSQTTTDKQWLESYIKDDNYFAQDMSHQEVIDILARLYAAKDLDSYFFHNMIAYILTQTIMFSPAYELESTHNPNVSSVYNRIVSLLEDEASLRYITYLHTKSEDNWRRFRSPEDNGREMLEIYTGDINDSQVPLAATALQNWSLNRDSDTLVIGLNKNKKPIKMFGATIYDGDDFYREMVLSQDFKYTVTSRIVTYFFADSSLDIREKITQSILKSDPQTFQDIFKQILFSKEYLLYTSRVKTAEELFFSLAKKINFQHKRATIYDFESNLRAMHQASMRYKLGKLTQVPLDTLSFITCYKYFRDSVLLRNSNSDYSEAYNDWRRQGWSESFIANENFTYNYENEEESLVSLIDYIFQFMIFRNPTDDELNMFKGLMLKDEDGTNVLHSAFNMFTDREHREENKRNIVKVVLDYISRLDDLYFYKKVVTK